MRDGLVNAWERCVFQPEQVQCRAGQTQGCLAPAKVEVLQAIFGGAWNGRGEAFYAS